VDAGYRWAYWVLEDPGLVAIGERIDAPRLLACHEYWNPPPDEQSPGLIVEILPRVRRYLEAHRDHGVIYLEDDLVFDPDGPCHGWAEIEEV
jgi:hypothetical protein